MVDENTNVEGGAYSTAMAEDGDTGFPRGKPEINGDLAAAEKTRRTTIS